MANTDCYKELISAPIDNGSLIFQFKEPSQGKIGFGDVIVTDKNNNQTMTVKYSIKDDEKNTVTLNLFDNAKNLLLYPIDDDINYRIEGHNATLSYKDLNDFLENQLLTIVTA